MTNTTNQDSIAEHAFQTAILQGRLSDDLHEPNYAGHYMFMGYSKPRPGYVLGEPTFKHRDTREYLPTCR